MSHVCIQGFGAGYGQHHGAQDEKAIVAVFDKEMVGIKRVDTAKYLRRLPDIDETQYQQDQEPHCHHRAEPGADPLGAASLYGKQKHQYGKR